MCTPKRLFYCPSENVFYKDFPPTEFALDDADFQGLLCFSNDELLDTKTLIKAYQKGIFPWSGENKDNLVMWFSPVERPVFLTRLWTASRSLKRVIKRYKQQGIKLTINQCFAEVIDACADREDTWITPKLREALMGLHQQKKAISFEVKHKDQLIGGLYGIALYPVFFAESMFSKQSGASKYAFYGMMNYLKEQGYILADAQIYSAHLTLLGNKMIPRDEFQQYLKHIETQPLSW